MEVELDIYSGRPNPRFRLEPAAAEELLRRIGTLPPHSGPAVMPDGLGYRGLRVEADEDEPFEEIRISEGTIILRDRRGGVRVLVDVGRSLERWLVQVAAASLDPELVNLVRQQLGSD